MENQFYTSIDDILKFNKDALDLIDSKLRDGVYKNLHSIRLFNYKPVSKKALEFHKSISKTRLLLGGKRSAKSTTAIVEELWAAIGIHPYNLYPPPPLKIRHCTVDFINGIKGIALPMFEKWGGAIENGPIFRKYWAEDRILELHNGTTIDMKSYDQSVDKFEGVERHLVVEDEIPPKDVHQSNFMRTISEGINGKIVITGTPLYGLDWVYDELYSNPEAVPPIVEWWHLKTYENKHISEEAIESIRQDPAMRDNLHAAIEGEYIPRSGKILKSFTDKNIIDPVTPLDEHMIIVGIDPHDRNPWGVVFVILNRENEYIVYDEILKEGTAIEIGALIKDKLGKRTPSYVVIDTSASVRQSTSGYSIKDQLLKTYGLYCHDADKDVSSGISRLNALFDPGNGKRPELYITRNCTNTIRQLNGYIWDDWARNRKVRDPKERVLKRDDHLCDSLRYVVMAPLVYRHPAFKPLPPQPKRVNPVTSYF